MFFGFDEFISIYSIIWFILASLFRKMPVACVAYFDAISKLIRRPIPTKVIFVPGFWTICEFRCGWIIFIRFIIELIYHLSDLITSMITYTSHIIDI